MARMIRKQFYITKKQDTLVKRLAKERGVSEAEIIRQAIEQHLVRTTAEPSKPDREALERAIQFMQSLPAQETGEREPFKWNREDAYEERMRKLLHGPLSTD